MPMGCSIKIRSKTLNWSSWLVENPGAKNDANACEVINTAMAPNPNTNENSHIKELNNFHASSFPRSNTREKIGKNAPESVLKMKILYNKSGTRNAAKYTSSDALAPNRDASNEFFKIPKKEPTIVAPPTIKAPVSKDFRSNRANRSKKVIPCSEIST